MKSPCGVRKSKLFHRLGPCALERLESRLLLANVSWIGPSVGDWENPANWSSNPQLPGEVDDVTIPQGVEVTVSSSVPTIQSIMSFATLIVSAGSLTITHGGQILGGSVELTGGVLTSSTVEPNRLSFVGGGAFTMTGGTLIGNLEISFGGGLFWSGGEMASPGVTTAILAPSPIPASQVLFASRAC